ncbi:hypothetical protein Dimus_009811 [Dionaea muscipula]
MQLWRTGAGRIPAWDPGSAMALILGMRSVRVLTVIRYRVGLSRIEPWQAFGWTLSLFGWTTRPYRFLLMYLVGRQTNTRNNEIAIALINTFNRATGTFQSSISKLTNLQQLKKLPNGKELTGGHTSFLSGKNTM